MTNATQNFITALKRGLGPEKIAPGRAKIEILAGLTVALALVPEAVAFAFVAQVHPLVGLYAAFIVGLITAVIGGRPGMISGATGALAVVMVDLVVRHGVEYLFAAVVLMGLLQLTAGALRWGKFIRMVPYPVMLGFVNGLAIVIFLAQLDQFKVRGADGVMTWMTGGALTMMLGFTALTMFLIYIFPRVTKMLPAPLAAVGVVSLLVIGFQIDLPRVGDLASIEGGLPTFHLPLVPLSLETLYIILPYSLILAAIGLIESLLTLNVVADMTETKGDASRECLAQGVANTVTGFFGGMGGCAMIGQSVINVKSGGRTRLSGIAAALFLLTFILFASDLIEQIPLAALVGVMFMVVIGTFAWKSLTIMRRIPTKDALLIVLVTAVTVMTDLAIAVLIGVILSALFYAWNAATRMGAAVEIDAEGGKIYTLQGPLFFGSAASFLAQFKPHADPDRVVIDFVNSRVVDHSGLQAIDNLAQRYSALGKRVQLRNLSQDCKALLARAGLLGEARDATAEYKLNIGAVGTGH